MRLITLHGRLIHVVIIHKLFYSYNTTPERKIHVNLEVYIIFVNSIIHMLLYAQVVY